MSLSKDEDPAGYTHQRSRMVQDQLEGRGVSDRNVLMAMGKVPRHEFVPEEHRKSSYADGPLPIGNGQTISQPYIVALMTEALGLEQGAKVLDVGTGSGYQAAVLAQAGYRVYTIECVESLSGRARSLLERLEYSNIHFRVGDGRLGLTEFSPFDGIIVAAAPAEVPPGLLDQLAPGGRLVIPVGGSEQDLRVYQKSHDGKLSWHRLCPVRFVPLV